MGLAVAVGMAPMLVVLAGACGNETHAGADGGSPGLPDRDIDRARLDEPVTVETAGGCSALVDTPPLLPAAHVAIGTDVTYSSNPPSSGPHYPIWAAYQEFTTPVDRRYYVHDLEHGAIVLLYKCDDGSGCPEIVQGLRQVAAAIPDDPLCTALGPTPRVRVVITPDPLIDVPIAAAAWGWTYRATCLDVPSLIAFAQAHYDQGTEDTCGNGQTQF